MDSTKKPVSIRVLVLIISTFSLLVFFVNHALLSQETRLFSEAPVFFEASKRMSNMVYVKFRERIIDLPKGVCKAKLTDLNPAFPAVMQKFQRLQTNYAPYNLYKAIPSSVWGDVVRKHRRTGQLVTIKDMSQLFILRFSQFVPIDDIIWELEQLQEVEYAHGPIQAVSAASPNDSIYVVGDQWNLAKIEAPKA